MTVKDDNKQFYRLLSKNKAGYSETLKEKIEIRLMVGFLMDRVFLRSRAETILCGTIPGLNPASQSADELGRWH